MLTNNKNIPLPLAVMLATDNYDHNYDPKVISATTLLNSTRRILLSRRIPELQADIANFVPSRMGTALHEAMEAAWKKPEEALKKLGYTDDNIKRIIQNISFEVRTAKKIGKYTITGMYDCVLDGLVYDLKSTSSWKWVFGNTIDYQKQLSIYKWLNPEVITEDVGKIMYWFTDWAAKNAVKMDYPQFRIREKTVPLDLHIESFITTKLAEIDRAIATEDLPYCTDIELNRKADAWAYYPNPDKMTRASKVFNTSSAAYTWMNEKRKGIIQHRPGEVKTCSWCSARSICNQAAELEASGELANEII